LAQKIPFLSDFASLQGKRGIVVGGTSGIGRAIVQEVARAGADVLIHGGHREDAAQKLAKEIQQTGVMADYLMADLQAPDSAHQLVDRAWDRFGPLDFWVHNAGADLLTTPEARASYQQKLQILLDVDVRAAILATKQAAQRMIDSHGGSLLLIGWDQADRGMEGDSGELFAAAKNALMGFARSLAVSVAPKVRVNCIAPGWIRTAWGEKTSEVWQQRVLRETPLARWGLPEDIAKLARFLLSDEASYLTGQVINANGGAIR